MVKNGFWARISLGSGSATGGLSCRLIRVGPSLFTRLVSKKARAKDRVRLKISSHLSRAAGLLSWPEEKLICQLQINKVLFHFSTRAHFSDLSHCININYNFNPLCLLQIAARAAGIDINYLSRRRSLKNNFNYAHNSSLRACTCLRLAPNWNTLNPNATQKCTERRTNKRRRP